VASEIFGALANWNLEADMQAVTATSGAKGVDTVAHFTAKNCADLKAAGYDFVLRYLGSLSAAEIGIIIGEGLAVMPVTFCRAEGWRPNKAMGTQDGQQAVRQLQALAMPPGVTVWRDLEGVAVGGAPVSDYVNAWAHEVKAAGYDAGLYVGAESGLSSNALWLLAVERYWHSCSRVPDVATCGYCMVQEYPPNKHICNVQVDTDVIIADKLGRLPTWATA
jgi:hypothetical protein